MRAKSSGGCGRIDMRVAAVDCAAMLKRYRWVFLCNAAIGPLIGLMVGGLVTRVVPEVHEGEVSIEVLPDSPDDLQVYQKPAGVAPEEYVEPWILMEIESITNRDSLDAVMDTLELDRRWKMDRESARAVLKRNVTARSVRGTPVISIRVRHADRTDAGLIARELALTYKNRRLEIEKRAAEKMAGTLRTAIRDQEQKVGEFCMALAEIERTMAKNLKIGGTTTLLHIPESREHAAARLEMASAEELLHAMRINLIEQDNWGGVADYRPKALEEPQVSATRISSDPALFQTIGAVLGLLLSPLLSFMAIQFLNRRLIAVRP